MSFIYYNPNPERKLVGDCVIRAISKVTNPLINVVDGSLSISRTA